MAQYCQAGETARVTFPDGNIQDFGDTPITITCEDEYPDCVRFLVTAKWQSAFDNGTPVGSINTYQQLLWSTTNGHNFSSRIILDGTRRKAQIYCKGNFSFCSVEQWYTAVDSGSNFAFFTIESIVPYQNSPDKQKRLKIIGNSGSELFSALFADCNYFVECLAGCPPNTIDCGNCCLSCSIIFNQLSSLRAQLLRLK